MSVTINASTSSGLVMTSDLSGNLQFQNNGTSLPMGGVAPAFSAYVGTNQSITTGTFTKVQCSTKEFDTNNNYDATTNYRFTPTVAGYYMVTGEIVPSSTLAITRLFVCIYKNGSIFKYGNDLPSGNRVTVTSLIYCNGSTDFLEMYGYVVSAGTILITTGPVDSYFQACLVRGTP